MADLSLEELERLDAEATAEELGLQDSVSSDPSILDQVSGYLQQSPIGAVGTGALNAIALGQGDRVSAGLRSLIQDQSYMDALGDVRGITNNIQEEMPYSFLAGNIGGMAGMSYLTGGQNLLANRGLAYLYGAPSANNATTAMQYARSIGQSIPMSTLFSIGESDIEGVEPNSPLSQRERTSKALQDILIQAGYGAAGSTIGTLVGRVGEDALRRLLGTNLTPAQRQIAETLKDQSDESLLDAAEGITRANVEGQPLLLPEVLENNQLLEDAASIRAVAPNREQIENFLTDRAEQASNRISDKLTRELGVGARTPTEAGRRLKEGYENIITEAEAARRAETAPLYERSMKEDPLVDKSQFGKFFESKEGKAFERIAKGKRMSLEDPYLNLQNKEAPELTPLDKLFKSSEPIEQEIERITSAKGKISPTNLKRINELLNNKRQASLAKDAGSSKADLKALKRELNKGIEANTPILSEANKKYRELSKPINELKKTALGKIIKNVDDVNASKALVIFENQPENIAIAKKIFESAGKGDDFKIAARSYLEDLINKQAETGGKKAAKQMLKNQNTIERLKAAIGEDIAYDRIYNFLGREAKMENFPMGSPTASRGVLYKKLGVAPDTSSEALTTMGLINKELKDSGGIVGVARAALGIERRPQEKMIRELADMLLTPEGGTQSIEALLRNRNDRLSGVVGQGLRSGLTTTARDPNMQDDLEYQLMEAFRR